jgi:CRISPR-associated endonuclease/helicase Cas3
MGRGFTRSERLEEMKRLYVMQAFSDIEMARRLDVDRTTIFKDRRELESDYPFLQDTDGRWRIDKKRYVSAIKFNLHEALAVYLAARRASRQTRISQPHVANAIQKLAAALRQPMTERLVQAGESLLAQSVQPERVKVLEAIAEGWVSQQKVRTTHQGLRARQAQTHLVSPYLIEPSLLGDGTYLIGYSDVFNDVATFKVERIERAVVTGEPFPLPEDFDEQKLLQHAWGIWYGDGEPVTVKLHFFGEQVTRRVKETIWHPSQKPIEDTPDGCIWTAEVAEWREMVPWVRGWGADVEVVEPEELRRELQREAQRLAEMYGVVAISPSQPQFYAHSRPDVAESEWQLLREHLAATGELAAQLGRAAGISELARVAGNLHDIGKYSQEFQARLRGSSQRVDHATAGAREVVKLYPDSAYKDWAELISYCIAGHHSGLPDYGSKADVETDGTLLARRDKKPLKDFGAYQTDIALPNWQPPRPSIKPARFRFGTKATPYLGFSISFLTRMLFSTLVDADWLETERYMEDTEKPRGQYAGVVALAEHFNRYLQRFEDPQTPINRKRMEILNACRAGAGAAPGFFTLTVPTGGGKTLASMAFALNHAHTHDLERVIYIIPFTSIIEQNAAVFREALGELGAENILEHHSNYAWEATGQLADDETNQVKAKLKLAAENWDIPIVVTTNVQFFESLFASQKSQARKVHNIAKSVLVFDEAQMLPRQYLKPCLLAVQELVQNYGCSAVFCTATQPSLPRFFPAQTTFTELAPDPQGLFDFFRRVQVTNLGAVPDAELIRQIHAQQQALCIVNTRRHAKGLYDQLDRDGAFHLSTLMCPAHRKTTLDEIRQRLKAGLTCRVVSTQVMEAGIDVDFPVGFRALAGLDSIIQAAGRVNREMRSQSGNVFVFQPQTEFIKRTPEFIKQTGSVAEAVLRDHAADPTTKTAIEEYYTLLYTLQDERAFDAQEILGHFEKGTREPNFDFKTAAEKFKLIDESTVTVFIPYDDKARRQIEALKYALYPTRVLRQLQLYAVNIYRYEFENLQSKGVIQTIGDTYHVLDPKQMETYYKPATGLVIPERSGGEAVFTD